MHGVLIRDKKVLSEAEQQAEQAAGQSAMKLLADAIKGKRSDVRTMEAFEQTTQLLKLNPELTLAWNYRREILLAFQDLIPNELEVVKSIMVDMRLTKSYCLWNHRRWILKKMEDMEVLTPSVLESEKFLISTILSLDSRNFHCWTFRLFLTTDFNLVFDDVSISHQLIEADFSNYSAWFLRMSVEVDPIAELDLVWNALFTEPNDQSVWQYHNWLVDKHVLTPGVVDKDNQFMAELESVIEQKDMKYLLLWKIRNNADRQKVEEYVQILKGIDPMRTNYYDSLCSLP